MTRRTAVIVGGVVAYLFLAAVFYGMWAAQGWPKSPSADCILCDDEMRFWSVLVWPLTVLLRAGAAVGRWVT